MNGEGGLYLEIGELRIGDHTISMTIAGEEGASLDLWDALALYGWPAAEDG